MILLAAGGGGWYRDEMKILLPLFASVVCSLVLGGCLTTPVEKSGGMGSITVQNTNLNAILNAAQAVFSEDGYTVSGSNYPDSVSFDKPSGAFGQLMYGSYGTTTTFRVTLLTTAIPGTNDFRLSTRVSRVSDAGEAGFEDSTRMMGLWSGEFKPLLRKIAAQAGGVGSGM